MELLSLKLSAAALLPLCLCIAQDGKRDQARVVESMARTMAAYFDTVESYTRLQHYSAKDERFGLQAEMLVRIHYDRATGKTAEILSRGGSPIIQSRVFEPLIKEEEETSKLLAHEGSLLTTHNYTFKLNGRDSVAGRPCYVLEMDPLRKDKHLIKGRALVDMEDFGVMRIEGHTADTVSFWIGKPSIIQDFRKISGFWFPVRRHAVMSSMLAGTSELTIDYSDYKIQLKSAVTGN